MPVSWADHAKVLLPYDPSLKEDILSGLLATVFTKLEFDLPISADEMDWSIYRL